MLGKVILKCFRKHESLEADFTDGLNVIRGANEGGKSSFLEGIMYATYGASVLTETFAETVTWGFVDKDLKVSVEHIIAGRKYTFIRSKSSASVTWTEDGEEKKVTGHTPVTAKAAEILGVEVDMANKLMMAGQAGLRSVLEGGPTAVADLINTLADVGLVDRVLERASKELPTGNDMVLRERMTVAEDTIINLQNGMPSEADIEAVRVKALEVDSALSEIEARRRQHAEDMGVADAALKDINTANQRHVDAKAACQRAEAAMQRANDALAAAKAKVVEVDESQIPALESRIAQVKAAVERRTLFNRVTVLNNGRGDVEWTSEGGDAKSEFESALSNARLELNDASMACAAVRSEVTAAKARLLTDGKCPTCGHTKSDPDHVAKHNAGVSAEIASLTQKLTLAGAKVTEKSSELKSLDDLASTAARFQASVEALEGRDPCITVDRGVYPAKIAWVGEKPSDESTGPLETALNNLRQQITANARAQGEIAGQQEAITTLRGNLADAQATAAACPLQDTASAIQARDAASAAHSAVMREATEKAREKQDLLSSAAQMVARREERMNQVTVMRAEIAKLQGNIAEMAYNNEFVADVRALKPAISTHLWNLLLVSASTHFSKMRTQQTVVTRTDTGFKANGRSIKTLSGSTLDILAVAMRASLIMTFMPELDFIVLDEPAHGCDEARTAELLGFLASVGFRQVILASHDSLSESVAQNVIRIGE